MRGRTGRELWSGSSRPTSCCAPTAAAWSAASPASRSIGADNVARLLLGVASKHSAFPWTCRVNGGAGLVFEGADGVVGVMGFTVADHRITEIDFVVNPEKLRRVIAPSSSVDGPQ